jgi:sister chromatid cohesion protein DCC1
MNSRFQVNGKWRLVDEKYMRTLLDVILCTAVEHDWPLSALPEELLVSAMHLDGYSKHMVRHCLKNCARLAEEELPQDTGLERESAQGGAEAPTDMDIDSKWRSAGGSSRRSGKPQRVWALHSDTVCLHRARQLLAATGSKWRLEDFMEAWAQDLPAGMKPDLKLLRGEALEEKLAGEVWLRPFSTALLPARPAGRFAALFMQKQRWHWEELEPYLK